MCPSCGRRIRVYDLIPVISYVILRGRCRNCNASISIRYPLVELFCGILGGLAAWRFGVSAAAFTGLFIWLLLVAVAFIDIEHMVIPNGLVIAIGIFGICHGAVLWDGWPGLIERGIGFFCLSLPMLLLTFAIQDAFGGGDIKLIAVCGFILGWQNTLLAGFIAVFLAGVYAVFVRYIKRDKGIRHIAFGQYICVGVFMAMLCGDELIRLYWSLFAL